MEPFYQDPREAARVLYDYLLDNPDDMDWEPRVELLRMFRPGVSIAHALTEGAEFFFARKSSLPKASAKVGAMLATTANALNINDFANVGGQNRGANIALALKRHSGERAPVGTEWPKKENDPEPKSIYVSGPEGGGIAPAPEPSSGPQKEK